MNGSTSASASRRLIGAIRALAPAVGLSMLSSVGALFLVDRFLPLATRIAANDAVGNYLQTLGTIYAVLLAFAVYVVWTEYTDVRQHMEAEANELFGILRMASGLPDAIALALRNIVLRYVEAFLEHEWSVSASSDDAIVSKGWGMVGELWDTLRAYEPVDQRCGALYAELLGSVNDLCEARTARITSGRARIPLRIVLYTGALSTVGSLCLFGVETFWIHALITVLLAGAVAHVLVVIEDLDDPFSGYWQAPKDPFLRLREYAQKGEAQKPSSVA